MSTAKQQACDLANALNFLGETLGHVDNALASVRGLAVILDDLAARADTIYGDLAAQQAPTPTDALRSVKTGGVQ